KLRIRHQNKNMVPISELAKYTSFMHGRKSDILRVLAMPSKLAVGKYKEKPRLLIHHLTWYSYHSLFLHDHIMVVRQVRSIYHYRKGCCSNYRIFFHPFTQKHKKIKNTAPKQEDGANK
ncbi:unnamed protein product, partial [Dovyalis caffra]